MMNVMDRLNQLFDSSISATLMRNSDGALTNPEFTIQSEDFPALPANPIGGSQTPSQQPPQQQLAQLQQGPGSATPNQLQANLISQAPQNLVCLCFPVSVSQEFVLDPQ